MIKNWQFIIKRILILIHGVIAILLNAQAYTIPEIDSLQTKEFKELIQAGKIEKAFMQEQYLINYSQKLYYVKGEARGYLNVALILSGLDRYKESLRFLEIGDKKIKKIKDDELRAILYNLYGKNYYDLGLYKQAVDSFNKSLEYAHKLKDKTLKAKWMYDAYDWKNACFTELNIMDSVYSIERKCMRSPKPILYIIIAERHLKARNVDSAEYYINKANNLLLTKKVVSEEAKANVLRAFGQLYIAKNENEKALEYLFQSLAIAKKMRLRIRSLYIYKDIATVYKNMNNTEKENEYLAKYTVLNDSMNQIKKSNLNIPIEKFLKEQAESEEKNKKNLYCLIIGISLAGITAITIFVVLSRRKQKQKNRLILQKEQENNTIKRKLDTASEKIVQLAIKGDPSFLKAFKDTYPEFYSLLVRQYPDLTTKDVKFCAMIKLGFSNKEIALYDNMSINTVESRKYRLRKKMSLSEEVNFNKWIMEMG